MSVAVRAATDADWPAIWPIFRAVARAGDTFAYATGISEADARAGWMVDAPSRTAVAAREDDGGVVGTARMGPNRPGPGDHVATASFMVAAASRGEGTGRALVVDALAWATAAGYALMQFNAVAETNVGAVGLYESLGFRVAGTVPGAFRHPRAGAVGLHVMYCEL